MFASCRFFQFFFVFACFQCAQLILQSIRFIWIEWLLLLGVDAFAVPMLTLVLFSLCHTRRFATMFTEYEHKEKERSERETKEERGQRVDTTQTNCKTCAILHNQYFVWLFAVRGKVLVLYTHAFICYFFSLDFVFVVVVFLYDFYALTDCWSDLQWIQIVYKLSSSGWSTAEFVKYEETNWSVIETQCLYKDIITWPFNFPLSTLTSQPSRAFGVCLVHVHSFSIY